MPAKQIERIRLRLGAFAVATVVAMLSAETQAQGQNVDEAAGQRAAVAILNRGGCGSCHSIPGIAGADGTVGPDLSRLGATAA